MGDASASHALGQPSCVDPIPRDEAKAPMPRILRHENWLPINREDIGMDAMLRIYAPDAEKMKMWKTPQLEMLPAAN